MPYHLYKSYGSTRVSIGHSPMDHNEVISVVQHELGNGATRVTYVEGDVKTVYLINSENKLITQKFRYLPYEEVYMRV